MRALWIALPLAALLSACEPPPPTWAPEPARVEGPVAGLVEQLEAGRAAGDPAAQRVVLRELVIRAGAASGALSAARQGGDGKAIAAAQSVLDELVRALLTPAAREAAGPLEIELAGELCQRAEALLREPDAARQAARLAGEQAQARLRRELGIVNGWASLLPPTAPADEDNAAAPLRRVFEQLQRGQAGAEAASLAAFEAAIDQRRPIPEALARWRGSYLQAHLLAIEGLEEAARRPGLRWARPTEPDPQRDGQLRSAFRLAYRAAYLAARGGEAGKSERMARAAYGLARLQAGAALELVDVVRLAGLLRLARWSLEEAACAGAAPETEALAALRAQLTALDPAALLTRALKGEAMRALEALSAPEVDPLLAEPIAIALAEQRLAAQRTLRALQQALAGPPAGLGERLAEAVLPPAGSAAARAVEGRAAVLARTHEQLVAERSFTLAALAVLAARGEDGALPADLELPTDPRTGQPFRVADDALSSPSQGEQRRRFGWRRPSAP